MIACLGVIIKSLSFGDAGREGEAMGELPQLDQFNFHAELAQSRGPVLVLFGAPACGACRHWRTLLASEVGQGQLLCYWVDVQRDAALAQEFELFHLPALYLYKDGRFQGEVQAQATPAALRQAVAKCLVMPAAEAP